MKKTISRICSCVLLGLGLSMSISSCNGAKAYVKKAIKLEEAGMMEEAASHYMTALRKKSENLDALVGLKRTGQITLSRHLSDFDAAVFLGDRESAIDSFHKAEEYNEEVTGLGVTLVFPQEKHNQYQTVKNAHVEEIYVEGSSHLENLRYDKAYEIFERIEELLPGFKDAKQLGDYSYCKPRYESASDFMSADMYRSALKLYNEILVRDADYENASDLKEEALEQGKYTIALMKFDNGSTRVNIDTKLSAYVEQNLLESTDPFLTVVDRESLNLILQEQHLDLSGLTSGAELEVGSILGAKAILKGTVLECSYNRSSLNKQSKNGFESYRVEKVNDKGKKYYETKYRPITYMVYSQNSDAKVSFNLKIISMETGSVISSNTVTATVTDNIRYANYGGNKNNVFPANSAGMRDISSTSKNNLKQMLNSRRDVKNADTMIEDATKNLAAKVKAEVEGILLQQVK